MPNTGKRRSKEPKPGARRLPPAKRPSKDRSASEQSRRFKEGVLSRLIAVLEQAGVAEHGRTALLASMTGRNRQTVTSWLRGKTLPDLASFTSMAVAFDFDMYYLLGMTKVIRRRLPAALPRWAAERSSDMQALSLAPLLDDEHGRWFTQAYGCPPHALRLLPMVGDAMSPDIEHQELIAIDTRATRLDGDGVFALQKDDALFVRRVEVHIQGGCTLHATNPHYSSVHIDTADDIAALAISILGRVAFVLKSSA
jgi:transcriptional regulator with XRE-family HTH domain